MAAPEKTIEALVRIDAEFQRAVAAKDMASLDRLLTDDFILITSSSRVLTKQDLLTEISAPELHLDVNAPRDVHVRVHADTAIITAVLDQKGREGKTPFDTTVRYTDTWVRTNGEWQQVSGHASLLTLG